MAMAHQRRRLVAELARFNPDPALAQWLTGALQQHSDQAQKDSAEARRQITLRETELRSAQIKIKALTLELAHLRRMRFGVRNEALTAEQRDLFQETLAADLAAAEAELARRAALATPEAPMPGQPRTRAGCEPLPEHLRRIEHRHEPDSCTCGQCGHDLVKISEDGASCSLARQTAPDQRYKNGGVAKAPKLTH